VLQRNVMNDNLQGELVLQHLEKYLGKFSKQWRSPSNDELGTQILIFPGVPDANSFSVATFGLSSHELLLSDEQRMIRIELMICADSKFDADGVAALLMGVATECRKRHAIPGIHAVIPGSGPVLNSPGFEHLYVTLPGYFPAEFEICKQVVPSVLIGQLVPITTREAHFVREHGWKAFEERLVEQGCDLIAFDSREEIVT
jgi:hypothetical protein